MPDKMTLNEAIYLVLEVADESHKSVQFNKNSILKSERLGEAIKHLQSFLGDYYINERYVK